MTDLARALLYASQPYALPILRPIQRALRAAGSSVAWFFDGPGSQGLRPGELQLPTVDDVRGFDPQAVFVPGNHVPSFFPGAKVEVFHGFSVGKRRDARGHFRIRGQFDLYCTQGPTTTPRFAALARRYGHFRVEETGWAKVDPLFWPESDRDNPWRRDWSTSRPIVIYASTFTPRWSSAALLRRPIAELAAAGRFNWIVTLHPKMPEAIVRAFRALEGPHLRVAPAGDVIQPLVAADAMVSDTSSIVFEFLLLHKAAVTFRNARPGPHLIDIREPADLLPAIDHALARPAEQIRQIADFANTIHPWRDGQSSERVLAATRRFLSGGHGGLRDKPLNLWRTLQLRRQLGYWRWP